MAAGWIGTVAGLSHYDGGRFTTYTVEDGLGDDKVFSLMEDEQGDLWIGTGGGLSCYDGERFITYADEDGLGKFGPFLDIDLLQDRDGAIWVRAQPLGWTDLQTASLRIRMDQSCGLR